MLRYQEIAPSPALAANVACFWAIAGAVDPGPPAMNRVLPDGCMDMIFDFAGVSRTGAAPGAGKVIAVGAMRRALVVEHQGRVDLFGVRFRPGGAVPLLKIPAFELTDLIAGLDHFWPEANRLADIIQAGPPAIEAGLADPDHGRGAFSSGRRGGPGSDPDRASEHARLRLRAARLEAVLLKKLDLAAPVDPLVRAGMRIIRLAHGDIPVRSLELRLFNQQRKTNVNQQDHAHPARR